MKTATLPPVRIDAGFRRQVEQSLQDGESLTALVETALRHEIVRRTNQSEFVRLGLASIEKTTRAGNGIPAEAVIAKLEAKLAAVRRRRQA